MYDELTTDLRRAANTWLAEEYKVCVEAVRYLLKESADAIEELSRENESLAKSVNEASEILRRRWIPVTERLPKETGDYIVFAFGGTWKQLSYLNINFYDGTKFFAESGFEVTHWMPLPEPPKEE